LRFEEAVVHAAQFAGEGAPGAGGLAAGKAGHARDHWMAGCYKSPPSLANAKGRRLRIDYAELSLIGARDDNQDRVATAVAEHAAMLVAVDGMGGHADGARAAEATLKALVEAFWP